MSLPFWPTFYLGLVAASFLIARTYPVRQSVLVAIRVLILQIVLFNLLYWFAWHWWARVAADAFLLLLVYVQIQDRPSVLLNLIAAIFGMRISWHIAKPILGVPDGLYAEYNNGLHLLASTTVLLFCLRDAIKSKVGNTNDD